MKRYHVARSTSVSAIVATLLCSSAALGQASPQAAPAPNAPDAAAADEIVVSGFRKSLDSALNIKRSQATVVDSIVAEDIGKFPDANLAESMQRIPGVAIQRGEGGEGRSITVRGLGPIFTRVRVNGMEAASQVGANDANGQGNRGRSFDFSAFPSEIFSALQVRKTSTADVQEGSLGATIDLRAPRPFDFSADMLISGSVKAMYNDLPRTVGPRLSGLFSKKFGDFGVLVSAAYTRRKSRDEGYSPAQALSTSADGGFCSPLGFAPQNPVSNPLKGTNAQFCATGVPRTSNPAAYATITAPGVFFPRLPRYYRSDMDYNRLGLTGSLQWKPGSDTDISVDGIYTRYHVDRADAYLAPQSFARSITNQGKPDTSVLDAVVNDRGSVVYGVFNGVDLNSSLVENVFTSELMQGTITVDHRFSDLFEVHALAGRSRSRLKEPLRINAYMFANNVNGFTYDARDTKFPLINYGNVNIADPASYLFTNNLADGTTQGVVSGYKGGTNTDQNQYQLTGIIAPASWLKIKLGGDYRRSDFTSSSRERPAALVPLLPASTPAGGDTRSISRIITGFGRGLGSGLPDGWAIIDFDKFAKAYNFSADPLFVFEGPETGTSLPNNFGILETVKGAFAQAEFKGEIGSIGFRGDIGIRYVKTDQRARGFVTLGTAVNGRNFSPTELERSYSNWLPSFNLAVDVTPDVILRVAGAKVIARPDLTNLSPSGGLITVGRSLSIGNANLDPISANTLDFAAEWYFAPGSLLSIGAFYKDVKTYIQRINQLIPFSETGLPDSLLTGTTAAPSDLFTVGRFVNTPGGPLKGIEVNYQQQLRFLPGFLRNTGVAFSYTYVKSSIDYTLTSTGQTTRQPLVGLSKNQISSTVYYEDNKFSIRSSVNYRSGSIMAVPSTAAGNDIDLVAPTLYVDASASYNISDALRVSIEAQNLTDEHIIYYTDSKRKDVVYNVHSGRIISIGASLKY